MNIIKYPIYYKEHLVGATWCFTAMVGGRPTTYLMSGLGYSIIYCDLNDYILTEEEIIQLIGVQQFIQLQEYAFGGAHA